MATKSELHSMSDCVKESSENEDISVVAEKKRSQSLFQTPTKVSSKDNSEVDSVRKRKISEPKNWKTIFTINGDDKTKVQNDNNKRTQNPEGNFLEKFSAILRQKIIFNEEKNRTSLAGKFLLMEEECTLREELECTINIRIHQDTLDEYHSEGDNLNSDVVEDLVGWNAIEELYEEIIYEILHLVGCEDEHINKECLFSYLQDVFQISNTSHEEALKVAGSRVAPNINLKVEVIEAKHLPLKDLNGASEIFVTVFIQSSPTHRYSTSAKSEILRPKWEENFLVPITNNGTNEILIVEVWEVKGAKGLRKFFNDNELVGRASIQLNTFPASGRATWFSLENKLRMAHQGSIQMRLSFCSEKNRQVAAQEHHHLLKMLLLYELRTLRVTSNWWAGKLSCEAETILTQHCAQSGMSSLDLSFVRWSVFSDVHASHSLSYALFDSILDKLIGPIQSETVTSEELKLFWKATIKFLPSCFSVVRNIRNLENTDKNGVKTLTEVMKIISKVSVLQPPEVVDLFPADSYSWLRRPDPEVGYNFREVLNDAVYSGALTWFRRVTKESQDPDESNLEKLQYMEIVIQMVRSDLLKALEYYDATFETIIQYRYASALFLTYEIELVNLIEPVVTETCCSLKLLNKNSINMGTTLLKLFMLLREFTKFGRSLCPVDTVFKIEVFHRWFFPAFKHWLDIAVFKAKIKIAKAIELDELQPVDESVKHSSSAVDTFAIFHQIKVFWQELDWPEAEGAFTFVAKIIDDICYCCDFYAETMSEKVAGTIGEDNMYEQTFVVTKEWCLAINNIDYIRNNLRSFVTNLGTDEIIAKLAAKSSMGAKRCEETLENVILNALETEENRVLVLIDTVAEKMSLVIRKFVTEGAEVLHQDCNSMDSIMSYLEDALTVLNSELNKLNFQRMLDAIWREIENIMEDLVQSHFDKRRQPHFYANLLTALKAMVINFRCTNKNCAKVCADQKNLDRVEKLLRLHAFKTTELIHQYYKERLVEQNAMIDKPFGQLAIHCCFKGDVLGVEIVNARNLLSMNTDGTCDAYVKLHFHPEDQFTNVPKLKTTTQSKTLFPLFDERFEIQLSQEQKTMKDAVIMFSVKNEAYFGMSNKYLADCFLSFSEIVDVTEGSSSIQQTHLTLNRPKNMDSESLKALEQRQDDKQAREFLKKLHQKS